MSTSLQLPYNLTFPDLYTHEGLSRLDAAFIAALGRHDVDLHNRLMAARADRAGLALKDESQLLIDTAPYVEDFIADLFGITKEVKALTSRHQLLTVLYDCKRLFVQ